MVTPRGKKVGICSVAICHADLAGHGARAVQGEGREVG